MKIILNFALSADGKIAMNNRIGSPFTSQRDLQRLHEIRLQADAILVGRGTLEADQMSLTIPDSFGSVPQPLRLIISRTGRFDFQHKIFQKAGGAIHLLVTGSTRRSSVPPSDLPAGVQMHYTDLPLFLETCREELGIKTLLCEGGGQLARSLADLDKIDEIHLTWAGHSLFGGREAPTLLGTDSEHLLSSQPYELVHFEPFENGECFLSYRRQRGG